jgi:hypothetical protein
MYQEARSTRIEERGLRPDEVTLFQKAIEESPYMGVLSQNFLMGIKTVFIAFTGDEPVGILAFPYLGKDLTGQKWWEFGPMIVLADARGQKLGKMLVRKAKPFMAGKSVFVTSHNAWMVKMIGDLDFVPIKPWQMSLPVLWAKFKYIFHPYTFWQKLAGFLGLIKKEPEDAVIVKPFYGVTKLK